MTYKVFVIDDLNTQVEVYVNSDKKVVFAERNTTDFAFTLDSVEVLDLIIELKNLIKEIEDNE